MFSRKDQRSKYILKRAIPLRLFWKIINGTNLSLKIKVLVIMLPNRWLIFLNPTFIFYDPEEELQKACVLLAEECRQLGSMVHWLASFVGMLLAVIPTVCIFSAPLFLDLPRYFDTFFMEDLGSLFHRRVLGNRYSSSEKFGGFEYWKPLMIAVLIGNGLYRTKTSHNCLP